MIVVLIGTTITPWMQFYLQASVVEKGITRKDLNLCRVDVILGCIVTDVVAFFVVVACAATIYTSNHREISDVAEAARALAPFAGQFAAITCGLYSLIQGAARIFEAGQPGQALVEMETGLMIVMAISDGATLAVLAALDCDTDIVSYEMTQLVEAVGHYLTPALRAL